jgi:DNA-binding MarR family transcriptional regulator
MADVGMSTLFAALSAMRSAFPRLTLRQAIVFLYVCENEGLSLHELAFISMLSDQTTSRAVRLLSSDASESGASPLLVLKRDPADRRLLLIHLTAHGNALRLEIDAAISRRRTISVRTAT